MNTTTSNQSVFFKNFNSLANKKTEESELLKNIFQPTSTLHEIPVKTNTIGIEILKELPNDLQTLVLNHAEDTEHFNHMRLLCNEKVVNNQAIKMLKSVDLYKPIDRIAMKLPGSSPQKYLWKHVFQEIRSKCSPHELEIIVALAQDNTLRAVSNKAQTVFEKAFKTTSILLSNPFIRVGIGIVAGYQTWKITALAIAYTRKEIIPIVVNKIINITPLAIIRLGNYVVDKIYPWRNVILLGSIGGRLLLPRTSPLTPIFKAAIYVVLIPFKISMIPINIAMRAFQQAIESSRETSRLMSSGADRAKIERIKKGLDTAETLWVQHMIV